MMDTTTADPTTSAAEVTPRVQVDDAAVTQNPNTIETPWQQLYTAVEASRRKRKTLNTTWRMNNQYRRNKTVKNTETEEDVDQITVPIDWARTKNKIAQLFFQVPEVKVKARRPDLEGASSLFKAALNYELDHECRAYHLMDECLGDAINTAGMGICFVGMDASFEPVEMPAIDTSTYSPEQVQALTAQYGGTLPTTTVQRTVYQCYYTRHVSPAHFLWPADFTSSDWNLAPWLGYDDKKPLAEAIRDKWVDQTWADANPDHLESTNEEFDNDPESKATGKYITYAEVFYRKSVFDPNERDPRKIGRLVFVAGKKKPVVDEDFQWQRYDPETRNWIGMTSLPIKVVTLTSMSDDAIAPSDTEMGRTQVKETNRSRTQQMQQRQRSQPMRWFDVNLVDEAIVDALEEGTYNGMVPMNGPGDNAIGEVARANYPRESFEFQRVIDQDLDNAWSMGPNQNGMNAPGDTSATEAGIINTAAGVRQAYEQARVLRFFIEIAEGVGALMQMFQEDEKWIEFTDQQGAQAFQAWDRTKIRGDFAFECKPDAALRVDVAQKRGESLNVYKLLRRDPLVNGAEIAKDVLIWHGYDMARAMVPPPPPEPKPIALRLTVKGADLTNPIVVAMAQKNTNTPITPDDLSAAKKLMDLAGIPSMPPQVLPTPQPNQEGQLPTVDQIAAGHAKHPGPPEQVDPLGQRYETGGGDQGD